MAGSRLSRIRSLPVLVLAGLGCWPGPASGGTPIVEIRHHAAAERVRIEKRTAANETRLSFATLGRQFDLTLTTAPFAAGAGARPAAGEYLHGSADGLPGSWARITLRGREVSGALWTGTELLLLDGAARLRPYTRAPWEDDTLLIVNARDIVVRFDAIASSARDHAASDYFGGLAKQGAPARSISVGLVADAAFTSRHADARHRALAIANVADGIFSEQLDLHLDIATLSLLDEGTDPFTETSAAGLVVQLGNLKQSRIELREQGLVHLLSGREFDDDLVGSAELGAACGAANGAGVTQALGSVVDSLVMAHEIAHNLNAPHDGETGSACAGVGENFLMAPRYTGSAEFSGCSVNEIRRFLDTLDCLADVSVADVGVVAGENAATVAAKVATTQRFSVSNPTSETAFDVKVTLSADRPVTVLALTLNERLWCDRSGLPVTCELGPMYPGETVDIDLDFLVERSGAITLTATAVAANDAEPANDTASTDLEVLASTDLAIAMSPRLVDVRAGDEIRVETRVTNSGDLPSGALVDVYAGETVTLATIDGCSAPNPRWLTCDLGDLGALDDARFVFVMTIDADPMGPLDRKHYFVDARVTASGHDVAPDNNEAFVEAVAWGTVMDLAAAVSAALTAVEAGVPARIDATVSNAGVDTAPDVQLELRAQAGVDFRTIHSEKADCTLNAGLARCEASALAPGESVSVSVDVLSAQPGRTDIDLRAWNYDGLDTDLANNRATVAIDFLSASRDTSEAASGGGGRTSLLALTGLLLIAGLRVGRMRQRNPA